MCFFYFHCLCPLSFFSSSPFCLPLSIYPHLTPLQCFTHSPSFSPLAYAANQNRFPWGTALNIILNFSFLISAASFTLNLLPRAKRQHGIHETCTRHRKCDYSLSISLSVLLSLTIQDKMGIVKLLTPQTGVLFLLSLSPPSPFFLTPSLPDFTSLSIPPISFSPLTCLDSCYHSSPGFNVSFSLSFPPSIFHSLMLRGNSLPPLPSLIHHHHPPFLSLFFYLFLSHTHNTTLTMANPVCI